MACGKYPSPKFRIDVLALVNRRMAPFDRLAHGQAPVAISLSQPPQYRSARYSSFLPCSGCLRFQDIKRSRGRARNLRVSFKGPVLAAGDTTALNNGPA